MRLRFEVDVNAAHKGRRAEHKARALLEAAGYVVIRSAGSKGPIDLAAWDGVGVRLIAVKSGTRYLSALEREALALLAKPPNAVIEVWTFRDRCKGPTIERL